MEMIEEECITYLFFYMWITLHCVLIGYTHTRINEMAREEVFAAVLLVGPVTQ
jgi:hypothetical protein